MDYVYCLACERLGPAKWKTPGSCCLEIFLWLFFIIPGVFYTAWRRLAKKAIPTCSYCGSEDTISPDSPRGIRILGDNWREKVP